MTRVGIMETAIRDGHQSLLATRMRTEDMIPVLEQMDAIGYHSIECWGGATFDPWPTAWTSSASSMP